MKTNLQSVVFGLLGLVCTLPLSLSYSQAVQAQHRLDGGNRDSGMGITLHNHNRKNAVVGFYVWKGEDEIWSRNRLYAPLEPGSDSQIRLSHRGNSCNYRVKLVYSNDREAIVGINACESSHLIVDRGEIYVSRGNPDRN